MKNNFQKYIDQVLGETQDQEAVRQFEKAIELFESSNKTTNICKDYSPNKCLSEMLSVLVYELNTHTASLIAGVLSQAIENKEQLKPLKKTFPSEIIGIVEAYINIENLQLRNIAYQADEIRSLILSVAGDVRAVLLHFSLQIVGIRQQSQDSEEYQDLNIDLIEHIYIPLSHRLGFYRIKSELEDRVLAYRRPQVYESIQEKLKLGKEERDHMINDFLSPITSQLDGHGIVYEVKSRTKSISSIWVKMQKQNIPFEKVFDLWAVRIITESDLKSEKAVAWHVFSIITNIYPNNLSRLRDWISIPKETGYESLHATVQASKNNWVEVQIRSRRMDDEAENGMAAHWKYKGGKIKHGVDFWLQNIREAIQNKEGNTNTIYSLDSNKFSNEVYVFTPTGQVKKLRLGSSVLDFAFAIHTDVGSQFAGAKVNGKIVPIDHVLTNGDQVEIITAKNRKPTVDWLKIVVDPRTKTKIKRALDEHRQLEIVKGKEIIERRFKNWKLDLNQDVIDKLVKHYKLKKTTDLYFLIALEKVSLLEVKNWFINQDNPTKPKEHKEPIKELLNYDFDTSSPDDVLVIDKLSNINYSLAKCCNPIRGDSIFGFVTVSKGISIHRVNCPNGKQMKARYPYRIIDTVWKQETQPLNFRTTVYIEGRDNNEIINRITQILSNELKMNIGNLAYDTKEGRFKATIKLMVYDIENLDMLTEKLKKIKGVEDVYR